MGQRGDILEGTGLGIPDGQKQPSLSRRLELPPEVPIACWATAGLQYQLVVEVIMVQLSHLQPALQPR